MVNLLNCYTFTVQYIYVDFEGFKLEHNCALMTSGSERACQIMDFSLVEILLSFWVFFFFFLNY